MLTPAEAAVTRSYRIAAALAALLGALLWAGPGVLRPELFDGDAAHHVFWLYRYVDAALFPGDVTVEYLRTSAPVGYRALYATLAAVMDPMLATRLVAMALYLWCAALAWKIGLALPTDRPARTGLLAVLALAAMLALSLQTDSLPIQGMQRAFGLPLTLLCLWALVAARPVYAGVSWVLAALTYPVVLPVLGIGAGVVYAREMLQTRRMPVGWVANLVLGVAAIALVLFGIPKPGALGPAASYAEAVAMPEFGPGGRLDLWSPAGWGSLFWHGMTGLGWSPRVLLLLAACSAALLLLARRAVPPFAAWALLGTGLVFWGALRLWPSVFMFGLYLPNRHSRFVILAFGVIVLALLAHELLRRAERKVHLRERPLALLLVAAVASAVMLWPQAQRQWSKPRNADLQNVYAFLGTLPSDTLVAAHPDLANYIPLYARRSVLASTETSMPWMKGYYALVRPRLEASLHAAYATSIEELEGILAPYGAEVMVTGPEAWSGDPYPVPFDSLVRGWREQGAGRFVLQSPPESRVIYRSGPYSVVRVGSAQ